MAATVFRCRRAFAWASAGHARVVRPGTLVSADDPRYRANPDAFVTVADAVEQATAAPGERRAGVLSGVHRRSQERNTKMPHLLPPEDENSPASTFAPDQPGAGVVAADVADSRGKPRDEALPGTANHKRMDEQDDQVVQATATGAAEAEVRGEVPEQGSEDGSGEEPERQDKSEARAEGKQQDQAVKQSAAKPSGKDNPK